MSKRSSDRSRIRRRRRTGRRNMYEEGALGRVGSRKSRGRRRGRRDVGRGGSSSTWS